MRDRGRADNPDLFLFAGNGDAALETSRTDRRRTWVTPSVVRWRGTLAPLAPRALRYRLSLPVSTMRTHWP